MVDPGAFPRVAGVSQPADEAVALTILHVDDDPINSRVLAELLGALGHVSVPANSAGRALELAAVGRFDAVLLDIHMPGMSGAEAVGRLRALAGLWAVLPIIAVTGDVAGYTAARCKQLGFSGQLEKPLSIRALRDGLAKAMANQPGRRNVSAGR